MNPTDPKKLEVFKAVDADLVRIFHLLKTINEPALVNRVGALRGHLKFARLDAIRDAEFGQDLTQDGI